jgi:hypothetical protein
VSFERSSGAESTAGCRFRPTGALLAQLEEPKSRSTERLFEVPMETAGIEPASAIASMWLLRA